MAYEPRICPEGAPVLTPASAGRNGAAGAAEAVFRLAIPILRVCPALPSGAEVAKRPTASEASFIPFYLNLFIPPTHIFFTPIPFLPESLYPPDSHPFYSDPLFT